MNLIVFMGECGIRYKRDEVEKVYDYVKKMIEENRVITINEENRLNTLVFFSVGTETDKFLVKDTWDYREHDKDGIYFYVEKMTSKGFGKGHLRKIHDTAINLYPKLQYGRWHRYGKIGDREVIIRRRNNAENPCVKE